MWNAECQFNVRFYTKNLKELYQNNLFHIVFIEFSIKCSGGTKVNVEKNGKHRNQN